MLKKIRFFSIAREMIAPGMHLEVDIYVNSSSLEGRERFMRLFKRGKEMTDDFFREHVQKHTHLYIPESQRKTYYETIVATKSDETEKVGVIKKIAIEHMIKIFEGTETTGKENILTHIEQSRDAVDVMIDLVQNKSMNDIQKILGDLSYHDTYTYDHSINVCLYAIVFYKYLKPNATRYELITSGLSGLLHDLGKVRVSNKILNNVGPLNEWDFGVIKKHPEYGAKLISSCNCEELSTEMLAEVQAVVLQHHENVNGTGYPLGLMGNEISFLSKVIAIIDFFDAVTTKRSYHEPLATKDALSLMKKSVGTKIDQEIFDEFRRSIFVLTEGKEDIRVGDDFDPCRPYQKLPIEKIKPKKTSISLSGEDDENQKVKIIDPRRKAA